MRRTFKRGEWVRAQLLCYQSEVSILGPVGYGPTTLPLRHSDFLILKGASFITILEALLPREEFEVHPRLLLACLDAKA